MASADDKRPRPSIDANSSGDSGAALTSRTVSGVPSSPRKRARLESPNAIINPQAGEPTGSHPPPPPPASAPQASVSSSSFSSPAIAASSGSSQAPSRANGGVYVFQPTPAAGELTLVEYETPLSFAENNDTHPHDRDDVDVSDDETEFERNRRAILAPYGGILPTGNSDDEDDDIVNVDMDGGYNGEDFGAHLPSDEELPLLTPLSDFDDDLYVLGEDDTQLIDQSRRADVDDNGDPLLPEELAFRAASTPNPQAAEFRLRGARVALDDTLVMPPPTETPISALQRCVEDLASNSSTSSFEANDDISRSTRGRTSSVGSSPRGSLDPPPSNRGLVIATGMRSQSPPSRPPSVDADLEPIYLNEEVPEGSYHTDPPHEVYRALRNGVWTLRADEALDPIQAVATANGRALDLDETTIRGRIYFRRGPLTESRRDSGRRISFGQPGRYRRVVIPKRVAAAFAFVVEPAPTRSDVWPDIRDLSRVPYLYAPIPIQLTRRSDEQRSPIDPSDQVPLLQSNDDDPIVTWPMNTLPSELYRGVLGYLSRDDIKAMRLTCKEFENNVSLALFQTVVVPFNTEIYGMLRAAQNGVVDVKGKGKAKSGNSTNAIWHNANDDDVYEGQGINVFKGFGRHIRKFGMSFDVSEASLATPPLKGTRQAFQSYWGEYDWPYQEYKRFDEVAQMENAADETFKMKTAFSYLTDVKELALSIDSGLGYLHGPDVSFRSKVFDNRPTVFGPSRPVPERKYQAAVQFWNTLKAQYADNSSNSSDRQLKHAAMYLPTVPSLSGLNASHFAMLGRSAFFHGSSVPSIAVELPILFRTGLNIDEEIDIPTSAEKTTEKLRTRYNSAGLVIFKDGPTTVDLDEEPVVPAKLKKLQREWLLETEWAQRAFISSYMVAIVDNPHTFHHVHTMTIARLSSRYITSISREDFWSALPTLANIKIHIIPDWRDVVKDGAGFVETPVVAPSQALMFFGTLLNEIIAPMKQIKSLDVGWAAGGERESGMFGRNNNLMPAPVLPHNWAVNVMVGDGDLARCMTTFKYVQHLTLSNCWITPGAVQLLIIKHQHTGLRKLTFDSVSLTTIPGIPGQDPQHNVLAAQAAAAAAAGGLQWPGAVAAPMVQALPQQPQHQQNLATVLAQAQAQAHQAHVHVQPLAPGQAWAIANQLPGGFGQPAPGPMHHGPIHNPIPAPALNPAAAVFQPIQHQAPPMAAPTLAPVPVPAWLGPHREGSWPWLLDKISPGYTLKHHGSTTSPKSVIAKTSTIQLLEFNSCGYAKLPQQHFDQVAVEDPAGLRAAGWTEWFSKRSAALEHAMMKSNDAVLGEVVQFMKRSEEEALVYGWGMTLGWENELEKEEPLFDGVKEGGTGRFRGAIEKVIFEDDEDEDE